MKGIKIKPIKYHFMLDTDRDKVPDFKDCRPFNSRLQHNPWDIGRNPQPGRKVPSPFRTNLDTDRDGVPDWKDCQPFNPRLQHIKPNKLMRMDIAQLPIYVSDRPGHEYHVLSKRAKKYAPRARTEMLSAIKKRPSIVGDIKELGEIGLFPSEESIQRYHEHKDAVEKLKKMKYSPDLEDMEEQLGVPSIGEEEKLFRYVHKSWGSPQRIATDVRFKMGSEIKDIDSSELGRGERAKKLVEDESLSGMMALEPFARRLEEKKLALQKIQSADFYSSSYLSPESYNIFDKDEALLQLGMMGSSKSEVDNVAKEYDAYLKDPHKYKGPYSGKRDRPHFTQMVKKGTLVFYVLRHLNTSEEGKTWTSLRNLLDTRDMHVGRILNNMQDTGIIFKQDHLYLITDLGRGVLQEVEAKGSWRYKDYVPKRSEVSSEHTAYTPYTKILPLSKQHKILRVLAGMPIEEVATPTGSSIYYGAWQSKTIPKKKEELSPLLATNEVQMRKLENTDLVFRPQVGWYQITRKGWNALKILDRGDRWQR